MDRGHVPVLLEEAMEILRPRRGRVMVDCTVGRGGHAEEMMRRGARVIGLDVDPAVRLDAAEFHHANFAALPTILAGRRADGILADLGVSSPQIDDPARGFSYRHDGPLDMRMDPTRGEPAWRMLARMKEVDLARAILELGDEENAAEIARRIARRRPRTTRELTELVCEVRRFTLERAAGAKLHPAARTFQAIRILVNRERANLERLLAVIPECLKPGGAAVIITFHSGEDRLVKKAFKEGLRTETYAKVCRRPICPGPDEVAKNPRASAAKLRWALLAAP
jgi:16S rRNA (cytosine1402-N4)-methyltransferase